MLTALAFAVTLASAAYLVLLGVGALVRPDRAKRFLGGFAMSRRVHFTELAMRILAGAALLVSAPRMRFSPAFALFGWLLVGTSLVLALLPWRLHQRFAAWSVPEAVRYMPLIGASALAGGLVLFWALV